MCFKNCFQKIFCCCLKQSNGKVLSAESQLRVFNETDAVYSHETTVELTPGSSFYVSGTILKNCEGFAVNLTYGHAHQDIALHVNPRLPQNYIVRNTKINGNWGKEETTSSLPFTLMRGHKFTIQILVTEQEYLVSVNGIHFTRFAHRVPYQRVTCFQVIGDVIDVEVKQLPIQEYPERVQSSEPSVIPIVQSFNLADVNDNSELVMPFCGKLLEKMENGARIHIIGRVKVLPHSFYMNLQEGERIWPHPTIAFHINPRFTTIGGKHVIVKNSWLDGKWDREERSEIHTDFMPSRSFHMIIEAGSQSYTVLLNNKCIAEYKYRIAANIVDIAYIHGDIKLKHVCQEVHTSTNHNNSINNSNNNNNI